MNVFSQTVYVSYEHPEERMCERTGCRPEEAKRMVLEAARNGEILVSFNNHRYIRFMEGDQELFLPCVKIGPNVYLVKSVLTWDMVKGKIQGITDYHAKKTSIGF